MRSIKKTGFLLMLSAAASFIFPQAVNTRCAVETTFDGKTPVAFEDNYGALGVNPVSGDLVFTIDLAALKTGSQATDSLLSDMESIPFVFKTSLGPGLATIAGDENDDAFHQITGTIEVNNVSYGAIAQVRISNYSDRSDLRKALLDLRLVVDAKQVTIPVLSGYFTYPFLLQVNDGIINPGK